ncbi:MAG: DedA family protein [Nitrospirae bacterium]|nr:MAG: DedA family protein [Nitrospirota bacterium]
MFSDTFTLGGLFLSAFLSSTLLPGSSEIVLVILKAQQTNGFWPLLLVATAGNTLGGMTSWILGRWLRWRFPGQKLWQPWDLKALGQIKKWGAPVLLFAWMPVIGDPLCLAGGWLGVNGWLALMLIGLGKLVRYAVLLNMV